MKYSIAFFFFVGAIVLSGCQTKQIANTPTGITITTLPKPTITPSLLPTITKKLKATTVPSQTVTKGPIHLQLPDWMNDPNQNILMYRMLNDGIRHPIDEAETVNFLNPDTSEKFSINMPDSFICWHDSIHAVFVHDTHEGNESTFLFVLDTSNGELARLSENDPLFNNYYFYTWMCDPETHQNPPQPEYEIKIETATGTEDTAYILDNQTGQSEMLTIPNDGIRDVIASFLPGKKFISVLQVNEKSTFSTDGFANQVSIYEFSNRKLVKTIQDNTIRGIQFPYTGNDLIYNQGRETICKANIFNDSKTCVGNQTGIYNLYDVLSSDSNYLIILQTDDVHEGDYWGNRVAIYNITNMRLSMTIDDTDINDIQLFDNSSKFLYMRERTTPCIVDIQAGSKKCIRAIPDRYPDDKILITRFTSDKKDIQFLHWGGDPSGGGLCFYDLLVGAFHCPTDSLEILKGNVVTGYELSPDERYISFTYEFGNCPICDGGGLNPSLAVIGRDGTHFIDLGLSNSGGPYGTNLVSTWRPLPDTLSNP